MKKLLMYMCIGVIITSCKPKAAGNSANNSDTSSSTVPSNNPSSTLPDTIHSTLNGFGELTADTMQKHFMSYSGQDTDPTKECIFFDSLTIHRIVNLLYNEIAQEKSINKKRTDTTDGIRIYFASYINVKKGKLKNTVLLVSTTNDGIANTPSGAYHRDYYVHPAHDILFGNRTAISGAISPKGLLKGETTYNPCIGCNDTPNCAKNRPHYITRKTAYNMLEDFKHKPIKTESEWFELSLFKSFADDHVHNGLRIYFSRHPDGKDAGKEAFILVTTRSSTLYKNEDYFDCATTNPYFSYYFNRNNWTDKHHPFFSGGGQDNGELCPANCKQ